MDRTIYQIFRASVDNNPGRTALLHKKDKQYQGITYAELKEAVDAVGAGLEKLGINKGDSVAIMSYNRPEWAIADLAVLKLGGIVVPIYHMPGHQLPPNYVKYILNDARVKLIFVENDDLFSVIKEIRKETANLEQVIIFEHSKLEPVDIIRFEDLRKTEFKLDKITTLSPDETATIVYTSGTTGEPKGVMLTHKNIVSNALSAVKKYHLMPEDVVISYLPLGHMFERTCGYYAVLFGGGSIGYAENLSTVARDAEEIRPTILLAVPRVIEKVYNEAVKKIEGSSPFKKGLVASAIKNLNEYANRKYKKLKIGLGLKLKCGIYNTLVASKFKKLGGGRIRLIVTGGAPLSKQIAKTVYVLGFNIMEGYGLTETSPVVTGNAVEDNRLGTVGKPFDGVEVRIGKNDEILVRGPNVMVGYFNKPEETAKVIDQDGWFHTGDQGKFDEHGNLVITGRIKELIVTSGGKKVAPAHIEAKITISPYIEQVVLYGDKRHYLVALVVPNREAIERYAQKNNILYDNYPELLTKNEIKEVIKREITGATLDLASYEKVKVFALLAEGFSVENGMMTATLKLKKTKVFEKYADLIELMYGEKTTGRDFLTITRIQSPGRGY